MKLDYVANARIWNTNKFSIRDKYRFYPNSGGVGKFFTLLANKDIHTQREYINVCFIKKSKIVKLIAFIAEQGRGRGQGQE